MRHWFCALSARPTSRKERVLPKSMSPNPRANTRFSAITCAARISASAARCRSSSIGSNAVLLSALDDIWSYSYYNRNPIIWRSATGKEKPRRSTHCGALTLHAGASRGHQTRPAAAKNRTARAWFPVECASELIFLRAWLERFSRVSSAGNPDDVIAERWRRIAMRRARDRRKSFSRHSSVWSRMSHRVNRRKPRRTQAAGLRGHGKGGERVHARSNGLTA